MNRKRPQVSKWTVLAASVFLAQPVWAGDPGSGGLGANNGTDISAGGGSGAGGNSVYGYTGVGGGGSASSAGNGGSGAPGFAGGRAPGGTVGGGNGSDGTSYGSAGGGGGAGMYSASVTIGSGTTVTGGNGGIGGNYGIDGFGGGGGGNGVTLTAGGTLVNAGQITGGNGGNGATGSGGVSSNGGGGGGGNGVSGSGITITNSGSITGGSGGSGGGGNAQAGTAGAAIAFTGGSNTLTLQTGSVIDGVIWLTGGSSATITSRDSSQVLDGGTVSSNHAVLLGSGTALTVDLSTNDLSIVGITGGGSVTKTGGGTLTIGGGNGWSGNTTVSAGTLTLDTYTQTSSQTLTIGATSNSSYGKLNVTGAATFNAGANLAVDVASANTLASGQTLSHVITAGSGLTTANTFSVTDNSALFNFTAVANNGSVDLNVVASGSGSGSSSTGTTIYRSIMDNRLFPAAGAAQVLDTQIQGTPTGDMANVVTAFGQLPDERSVARAADQTLPLNSGSTAMLGTLSAVNRLFSNRFAPGATGVSTGDEAPSRQVWIKPFGSHVNQSDQGNASGFSSNTWGMAVGYEGDVGKTRLGLAYAYANTHVSGNTDLSGTDNGARIDTHVLSLYGSRPLNEANDLALGFQADTGWNSSRSTRNLSFGGLSRTADGSYGAWSAHAGLNLSKVIALDASNLLVPALRMDYTRLQSQAYGESGAGALDLNVNAKTTQALVFGVDGRLVHAINAHSQIEASLGVGYDVINDAGDIVAAYAGAPGQSFTASGVQHSPWVFRGGLGYTYKTGKGSSVSLRYDAEGRTGYLNQSAMVKASWRF